MERAKLTEADAEAILGVFPRDYTDTLLRDWFAHRPKSEPKYPATAYLPIPASMSLAPPSSQLGEGQWGVRHAPNWSQIRDTTPGRLVANSLIFGRSEALRKSFPYYNQPWEKGLIGRIQQAVVDNMIEGNITSEDVAWTIDCFQWLGYAPATYMNSSVTIDTLRAPKKVVALKKRLLREHGDKLAAGDLNVLADVEKQLLDASKEELQDRDPGYDIYAAGARGSWGNNFKNTALMRGAIRKSDDPSQIHISTASLDEGIPQAEMHNYADIMVQASYGRSIMTQEGGYLGKQLVSAFQGIRMSPDPQSDCGSRMYLTVTMDNPADFRYRFVKDGAKLTEITLKNQGEYKGRTLQIRSPLYCGMDGAICSRCAGTMYYRMGILNIGVLSWRAGTVLLNAALKAFHDTTLKLTRIHLENFTTEITDQKVGRKVASDAFRGAEKLEYHT